MVFSNQRSLSRSNACRLSVYFSFPTFFLLVQKRERARAREGGTERERQRGERGERKRASERDSHLFGMETDHLFQGKPVEELALGGDGDPPDLLIRSGQDAGRYSMLAVANT